MWRKSANRALWWVVAGTIALLALALYVPFLRAMFRFAPLHADDLAISVAAALLSVMWFEVFKWARHRRGRL